MGLTTWKNAPDDRILKQDVTVAKNYLEEKEIRRLERTITGYFDYVEDLIEDEYIYHYLTFFNFIPFLTGGARAKLNKSKLSMYIII